MNDRLPPEPITELLDETAAARRLAVSVSALRRMRQERRGPAFVKIGRCVRYSRIDLDAYIDTARHATSDQPR